MSAASSAPSGRSERPQDTPDQPQADFPAYVDVAIVGAGFGGLGAAISLERAGFRDFAVLERAADVGGTWWWNTYPGCQCDIPSNLYSFSFARNPEWSHSYPEQPEILDYLRDCSRRFGVRDRIHFNCEMVEAAWDEAEGRWRIETSRGPLTARVLVAAPGLLSEPKVPQVPGLEDFEGAAFHSARWDDRHDLSGKRVAVVGTGASAIQIVPRIQPEVERLYVFQRTPPWVVPLPDREVSDWLKRLYRRFPAAQLAVRALDYCMREPVVIGMALIPKLMKAVEALSRLHLRRQVRDPELRRKLLPDYTIGCKRLLLSNGWYPALTADNVEVLFEGLEEVRARSVVAADGREREVDVIVFATGFSPTDPPIAHQLRGPDGRTLSEYWAGSPRAYRGTTVAGFPNLFLIYGPNVNLGHNSMIYMIESQYDYILKAMRAMRDRGAGRIEVREDVQEAYNEDVQERLQGSVWNDGRCASWYLDEDGENPIMWSDFTFRFRRLARRFDPDEHHLGRPGGNGNGSSASAGADPSTAVAAGPTDREPAARPPS